jgi:uridylate kinase
METTDMPEPIFKRVLLKRSAETLAANQGFRVDTQRIHEIAADVHSLGVQIAIVVRSAIFPGCSRASQAHRPCLRRSH